jgi:hypothetical protein
MTDVLRLRTMTLKSKFDGGKKDGFSIQQLIDLKRFRYLRWVYYTYDRINYNEEVLEILKITDMQIDKPGKDFKTAKAVEEFFDSKIPFKTRQHLNKKHKKIQLAKKAHAYNDRRNSKSSLQGKNHGR